MACTTCASDCNCAVTGAGEVVVTGTGTGADPYVVSYSADCEQAQDCVGPMFADQGLVYDDALATMTNAGAVDEVLTADGVGNASFQPLPAISCEEVQDCVGGMLNTQGFVYNDGAARFDNAGADTAVLTSDGALGASWVVPLPPILSDGRLTLTTGVPVTTSDVVGATTVFFTPFKGNKISLYNGVNWVTYAFTERSLSLAGLVSARPHDIFIYLLAGVLTLEAVAWTNATTRATGLVVQDGVYVKSGSTARRYLGTIYTSGTGTTEDSITKRFVWNYYNRLGRDMYAIETTASWAYTTTSFRASAGSSVQRLQMVIGVDEDMVNARTISKFHANPGNSVPTVGIGLDSTTVHYRGSKGWSVGNTYEGGVDALFYGRPGIGFHYLQSLEMASVGGGTITWYGNGGYAGSASISGIVLA